MLDLYFSSFNRIFCNQLSTKFFNYFQNFTLNDFLFVFVVQILFLPISVTYIFNELHQYSNFIIINLLAYILITNIDVCSLKN